MSEAGSRSLRDAIAELAHRLRARLGAAHRTVGDGMRHVLDESEQPDCCAVGHAARVKELIAESERPEEPADARLPGA